MTEEQLCNLVLEKAGRTEKQLPKFRILGLVTPGMEMTARMVRASPGYEGMQKEFPITIAAGESDLQAIDGLLFDPLKSIVCATEDGIPAVYLPTPEDLVWGGMSLGAAEPYYFSQRGTKLLFRNKADGEINTLNSDGIVVTNYIPKLTDGPGDDRPLPFQYRGLLAATIAGLATGKPVETETAGATT